MKNTENFTKWKVQPYPNKAELRQKYGIRDQLEGRGKSFEKYPFGPHSGSEFRADSLVTRNFQIGSSETRSNLEKFTRGEPGSFDNSPVIFRNSLDFYEYLKENTILHQNLEGSDISKAFLHDLLPTYKEHSTGDIQKLLSWGPKFISSLGKNHRKPMYRIPRILNFSRKEKNGMSFLYNTFFSKFNISQSEFSRWISNNTLSSRLKRKGISPRNIASKIISGEDISVIGPYAAPKVVSDNLVDGISTQGNYISQYNKAARDTSVGLPKNLENPTTSGLEEKSKLSFDNHVHLSIKDAPINYNRLKKLLADKINA